MSIERRPLLRLFDFGALKRLFLLTLGVSLVLIAETAFYLRFFSNYSVDLIIALTAGTGLVGYFYLVFLIRGLLKRISANIQEGIFPEKLIVRLLGILSGGIPLLLPGLISDAIGLLILLTFIKRITGRILLKIHEDRIKGAYEYLKLS